MGVGVANRLGVKVTLHGRAEPVGEPEPHRRPLRRSRSWRPAAPLAAEPIFLSRQYTHCTNCHYSPTGGGLLTPYGRSLSREELSTFGESPGTDPAGPRAGVPLRRARQGPDGPGERRDRAAALAPHLRLRRLQLDPRSPHERGPDGRVPHRRLDLLRAVRPPAARRAPASPRSSTGSRYQSDRGLGVRVGRFLPAYGVRLADHTTFTRAPLGFDNYDQIYGGRAELQERPPAGAGVRGPGAGRRRSGRRRSGRVHRHRALPARPAPAHRAGRVGPGARLDRRRSLGRRDRPRPRLRALRRLTLWTGGGRPVPQGEFEEPRLHRARPRRVRGRARAVARALAAARHRLRGHLGGNLRLGVGLNWLPRTHWNVVMTYYNDKDRQSDHHSKTLLLQLHLYL